MFINIYIIKLILISCSSAEVYGVLQTHWFKQTIKSELIRLYRGYLMAIKSSFFGSTKLNGVDAVRFIEQIKEGTPSPIVQENIAQGRKIRLAMKTWQTKTN
jgi:hypothetical protein